MNFWLFCMGRLCYKDSWANVSMNCNNTLYLSLSDLMIAK